MTPTVSAVQWQTMFAQQFPSAPAQATPSQATPELADRFAAMMAHAQPHAHVDQSRSATIVTKAIAAQSTADQQVPNDVLYLMQQSPSMSMQQMASASMAVNLETASMTANLQVKMAVVQSSKDALQTLMKNQ